MQSILTPNAFATAVVFMEGYSVKAAVLVASMLVRKKFMLAVIMNVWFGKCVK